MAWNVKHVINLVVYSIVGFGIALFVGGELFSALPANSAGANAIGSIITAVQTAITSTFGAVITLAFIGLIIVIVVKSGALNLAGGKGE